MHVAHTENKKYTQNLRHRSINQSINHFYCCMIKTGHIFAIIPHHEKTTTDSLRIPSLQFSGRVRLQPVLLITSGRSGYHTLTHTTQGAFSDNSC